MPKIYIEKKMKRFEIIMRFWWENLGVLGVCRGLKSSLLKNREKKSGVFSKKQKAYEKICSHQFVDSRNMVSMEKKRKSSQFGLLFDKREFYVTSFYFQHFRNC